MIANFGRQVALEDLETGSEHRCFLRSETTDTVVGDIVQWREADDTGLVESRQQRRNALQRPDKQGKLRTVAANIDQLVLVVAPRPECHAMLVDRYLVAAEANDIEPLLLLNKTDLLDPQSDRLLLDMLQRLENIGYPTLRSSAVDGSGCDQLVEHLRGKTSIFFGQSGVGKSSLVNRLLPEVDTAVGAVSDATDKGRHTTTTTRLYHLPAGGMLLDSPGVREFSMVNLDREQIEAGFPEFRPFLGHCKFRNCGHQQEPGCALQAAVADGAISEQRWDSYWHILGSLEH